MVLTSQPGDPELESSWGHLHRYSMLSGKEEEGRGGGGRNGKLKHSGKTHLALVHYSFFPDI